MVDSWPSDEDCRRAIAALEDARKGARGPIPLQAMRKALVAGLHPPDNRSEEDKEYDDWHYAGLLP
jgi:hypothetical protein